MKNRLRELLAHHEGKLADKWTLYIDEWENLFQKYTDNNSPQYSCSENSPCASCQDDFS